MRGLVLNYHNTQNNPMRLKIQLQSDSGDWMAETEDFDKKAFLAERKKMSIKAYERIMVLCQKLKKLQ